MAIRTIFQSSQDTQVETRTYAVFGMDSTGYLGVTTGDGTKSSYGIIGTRDDVLRLIAALQREVGMVAH